MMHTMMPSMEVYTLFWIAMGVLLCLFLVVATWTWQFAHRSKQQRMPPMSCGSQPKDVYPDYQQGYQPQQMLPETDEEGGQHSPYPPDEQSQTHHSEMMPLQY
jgi:hypothetical protein